MSGRMFPILGSYGRNNLPKPHPTQIPWSVADLAYSVYSHLYGKGQSLERLAERGGFGANEMDSFLPDWRERCAEIAQHAARADEAEREVARLREELASAQREIEQLTETLTQPAECQNCCDPIERDVLCSNCRFVEEMD